MVRLKVERLEVELPAHHWTPREQNGDQIDHEPLLPGVLLGHGKISTIH